MGVVAMTTETFAERIKPTAPIVATCGNHGTSDDTTRGALFYADRINATHTFLCTHGFPLWSRILTTNVSSPPFGDC
jgi:hypothetical protein